MEEKDELVAPEAAKEQETPKHPPMFSRDKMYKNVPFNVKQMDLIILGIVAAMAVCLIVGIFLK